MHVAALEAELPYPKLIWIGHEAPREVTLGLSIKNPQMRLFEDPTRPIQAVFDALHMPTSDRGCPGRSFSPCLVNNNTWGQVLCKILVIQCLIIKSSAVTGPLPWVGNDSSYICFLDTRDVFNPDDEFGEEPTDVENCIRTK